MITILIGILGYALGIATGVAICIAITTQESNKQIKQRRSKCQAK